MRLVLGERGDVADHFGLFTLLQRAFEGGNFLIKRGDHRISLRAWRWRGLRVGYESSEVDAVRLREIADGRVRIAVQILIGGSEAFDYLGRMGLVAIAYGLHGLEMRQQGSLLFRPPCAAGIDLALSFDDSRLNGWRELAKFGFRFGRPSSGRTGNL